MIEDPPLLTIKRRFERPEGALLDRYRELPTGWLVDARNGRGALDPAIKPLFAQDPDRRRLCGPALTCACGPDDNLALLAALEVAEPGDVLVASTEGFTGGCVTGDLLLGMARNRGVAGFVTDGLVRDLDGVEAVGLPVFCAGVTPNSCVRSGPGSVGLPVLVGDRPVAPGDLVVGDRDGVVVVPRDELAAVAERIAAIAEAERAAEARVRDGATQMESMREILESDRVRWLD